MKDTATSERATTRGEPAGPTVGSVRKVRVWDAFVRLFHWGVVACVAGLAWTGYLSGSIARHFDLHVWLGSALSVLVVGRLVWGLVGSRYARFAAFPISAADVRRHLGNLLRGRAEHTIGHNPLGSLMVLALLATLGGLVLTGLMALGGVFRMGPAKGFATGAAGDIALVLHWWLGLFLLGLVALHIGGVVVERLLGAHDLVRAMIVGTKRVAAPAAAPSRGTPPARPAFAALVVLAMIGGALAPTVAVRRDALPGAPVPVAGSAYADACSDCHEAYHPSLLPAENWHRLMSGLEDHFGEDASLDPTTTARVMSWLAAHDAWATETKPARHLGRRAGPDQLRMTDTDFWKTTHAALGDEIFARPPIYTRANCSACHRDAASGWFNPSAIRIPEPPAPNSAGN